MKHLLAAVLFVSVVVWGGFTGCGSGDKAGNAAVAENTKDLQKAADKAAAVQTPLHKKYDVKSGIIRFEVNDMAGTHREVVYFDDYGTKERIETYKADGSVREARFCDGQKMYVINEYTPANTVYIMTENATNGTEMRFDKEGFRPEQKEKYKYQDKPDMTVAGKNCSAYYMETGYGKVTFAGWSHITLYHNQETSYGNILKQAVSLEENAAIPAGKFAVPAGYEAKSQ